MINASTIFTPTDIAWIKCVRDFFNGKIIRVFDTPEEMMGDGQRGRLERKQLQK